MALTQTDLDALDSAIATGELTVEFNGRRVTYRSVPELLQARAHVAAQLAAQVNAGQRPPGAVRYHFATTRGF
jgi:hypothetical protein